MATAIVTGAARGIGLAISRRLATAGYTVHAVDADPDELTGARKELGAVPHPLDVTDVQAVGELAAELTECDALVNNAAIWRHTRLAETPVDEARRVLDVNVVGPLIFMQKLAPLLARSANAAIVNVSSITAAYSPTGTGVYPASKAALEALTRIAAVEFGPQGVRCNAVGPGIVPTPGTAAHYGDSATVERRARTLPLGRYGTPEDIAEVVAFLCSTAARYVTGQVVYADGGYTSAGADFYRLARDAGA
jgi:3-oxoacyl-[acyl-carrier protein] reductase